jgi:hypothetical protein
MVLARSLLYPGHAVFLLFLRSALLPQPELRFPKEFAALAL